jgi:hypothetical protein
MTSLLFGVTPTDALTFAMVSGGLVVVLLVACFIPARRATKVDPLVRSGTSESIADWPRRVATESVPSRERMG